MDSFRKALSGIDGGNVLDVATGAGGFVGALAECLGSFKMITGIDPLEAAIEKARESSDDERIAFQVGDVERLPFADETFDTVAIANSLHHLERFDEAMSEMLRVLKPGGKLIVFEMYRDDQSEAQQTHVDLHHWWASVDRARGVYHRETHTRDEIRDMLERLPLSDVIMDDHKDDEVDPLAAETVARVEQAIDICIGRAGEVDGDDAPSLVARGEELRERLHLAGFAGATHVIAVGTK